MSSRVGLRKKQSFPAGQLKFVEVERYQRSRIMRKPDFCLCETKGADQLRRNGEADQRLVFATRIVQFLLCLYPKFQPSSLLLRLNRLVCVKPGRKPRRPGFSRRGSEKVFVCFLELIGSVGFICFIVSIIYHAWP